MLSWIRAQVTALFSSLQRAFAVFGILLLALMIAGAIAYGHFRDETSGASALAATAQKALAVALDSGRIAARHAISAEGRADSLLLVATAAAHRAQAEAAVVVALRAQMGRAAAPECGPMDTALSVATQRGDNLDTAYTAASAAAANYKAGLESALSANATLTRAATRADSVLLPLREPFLSRLRPRAGVGFAAGINLSGRPDVVFGVTLGWHF